MKQNKNTQPTEAAELTLNLPFQTTEFVITGDTEVLEPMAEQAIAYDKAHPVTDRPKPVEAPQPAAPRELAYEDFSTLEARQVLRMKLTAKLYDFSHKTNMYGLLNERINADRDVAFARSLGLLSVTKCAKHEKAVSKLRQLV